MIHKIITIDSKEIKFSASASTPRLYRMKFQRDIITDLNKLKDDFEKCSGNEGNLEISSLEIFENVAFIMAFQADRELIGNVESWLDQFNVFDIYFILPQILELWALNQYSEVQSRKNLLGVVAR